MKTIGKVRLWREGKTVNMQVLEQDKGLGETISKCNGISVCSKTYPELRTGIIFVRGSNTEKDHRTVSHEFETETESESYCRKAIAALGKAGFEIALEGPNYIIHPGPPETHTRTRLIQQGGATVLWIDGEKVVAKWDGRGRYSRFAGLASAALKQCGLSYKEIAELMKESERQMRRK